jgi:type VI secretion system protein ImpH
MLVRRLADKDYSLSDWLDLFNHRIISLFYRAWEKNHFYLGYERAQLSAGQRDEDLFTQSLYSLVGLGTPFLSGRLEVDDEAILYYAGHFAHYPRSASSLESILSDYFNMPVAVEQFQGRWLYLEDADRSVSPSKNRPEGQRSVLGVSLIAGTRVWDTQSKFRLRVGPLTYEQFCRLMPTGDTLRPLCQVVRLFIGPEFDFDVQPVLKASEVPAFKLKSQEPGTARLGWNTWASGKPFERDAQDVVFLLDDV